MMANDGRLTSFVERIERLEAEKRDLAAYVAAVYAEAMADGYDAKILREVIKERRLSKDARDARVAMLDAYRHALGMLSDTPLGSAAMKVAAE